MTCTTNQLGPREAPSRREFSPTDPGSTRPMKSIPFLISHHHLLERLNHIAKPLGYSFEPVNSLEALRDHLAVTAAPTVWTESVVDDGNWRDVLEVCGELPEPPAVVVTTLSDSPTVWAEAAAAGVAEFLAVPFAAPEVRRCLLSVGQGREAGKQLETAV